MVPLPGRRYSVLVGPAALDELGAELRRLRLGPGLVVADRNAWRYHGPALRRALRGLRATTLVLPPGESAKSLAGYARVLEACRAAALPRDGYILAFGGGVIGDLAGFAAATWQRGVPLVMVPTTLLSQVDSAVGGKVAVNFGGVKNNVGSFHQPVLVVADTRLPGTLPRRELRSALAEVVKYGMIAEAPLLSRVERQAKEVLRADAEALAPLVARCCRIKARIVVADEREAGIRAHLNYGHTLGHAIEAAAGGRFRHGEAVALGMRAAARLGEELGYLTRSERERQDRLLDRLGLPASAPGLSPSEVLGKLKWDKKVREGRVRFVLTCGVGSASVPPPIAPARVRRALEALLAGPSRSGGPRPTVGAGGRRRGQGGPRRPGNH